MRWGFCMGPGNHAITVPPAEPELTDRQLVDRAAQPGRDIKVPHGRHELPVFVEAETPRA